ncbi:MAG: hypothetical protein Tsb0014_30360 [Pleurocapsa sp.]
MEIILFDTTMRDGELTPEVTMNLAQKIEIAELLDGIEVDVIEVGYPGFNQKDFQEISVISQRVKKTIICGLANSKAKEIEILGEALKNAHRGRINIFTNINTRGLSPLKSAAVLEEISQSITLARNYCDDIQWSAFDAVRSNFDFLIQAINIAISTGAKTICIPDTFGTLDSNQFSHFIEQIIDRVDNIEQAIISVHCHNDRGLAIENSLAAIDAGARQIECSLNGLGARKGNADLAEIAAKINRDNQYKINLDVDLVKKASRSLDKIINNKAINN